MTGPTTSAALAAPSTAPMTGARVLGAYLSEWRHEALRVLRTPAFALPFLALPPPIFLFFGVVLAGDAVAAKPALAGYLFSGWLVFAATMPSLFGVGCALALERQAGLLRLKRALPVPAGAVVIAKMGAAAAIAALAMALVVATAAVTGTLPLPAGQVAAMLAVLVAGTLPMSAVGLFIGTHVSGSAAPAISNVVFLPMIWLSGLFIPLPAFLEPWVVVWPAFHLNQLALAAAGVTQFRFVPPTLALAALAGITVLFGGLAVRRLAERG
ncbi:MAG: ABC transporter permease [Anaeromyxobacter sp.]